MNNHFKNLKLIECTKLINNPEPGERELLIKYRHEGKTNHRGIEETYYWKSLKSDVTKYINNCKTCQRCKYNRKPISFNGNPKQTLRNYTH